VLSGLRPLSVAQSPQYLFYHRCIRRFRV